MNFLAGFSKTAGDVIDMKAWRAAHPHHAAGEVNRKAKSALRTAAELHERLNEAHAAQPAVHVKRTGFGLHHLLGAGLLGGIMVARNQADKRKKHK